MYYVLLLLTGDLRLIRTAITNLCFTFQFVFYHLNYQAKNRQDFAAVSVTVFI